MPATLRAQPALFADDEEEPRGRTVRVGGKLVTERCLREVFPTGSQTVGHCGCRLAICITDVAADRYQAVAYARMLHPCPVHLAFEPATKIELEITVGDVVC